MLMRVMTMMIPLSLCSTGRVGGETTRTQAQRNPTQHEVDDDDDGMKRRW